MTIGESRIRTTFNPSYNSVVDDVKQKSAALVDICQKMLDATEDPETIRLVRLAQTAYEEAAMWAVKAATA